MDYSFVLIVALARALEAPTMRGGERMNRLLELQALLSPFRDTEYETWAKEFFALPADERIARSLRLVAALTELMSRSGLLGRRDVRED